MTSLIIESINCRGIRDRKKRTDIFLKAKEDHINILCLQETHLKKEDLNTIVEDWNVQFYIAGKHTNAGGVLIAVEKNFEYKCHKDISDSQGRYVILDLEITGVARFLLINLYAPNNDDPNFFENLFNTVENSDTKNLILVGDWNLVLDFNIDTHNYKKENNTKAKETVLKYIEKLDLIDIWRKTQDNTKGFTWRQNFYRKLARLDFFLISESLLDLYSNSKIKSSYKSDHCPIQLEIFISKTIEGKGIWKINNSLLLDEKLTNLINKGNSLMCKYLCLHRLSSRIYTKLHNGKH